MVPGPVPFELWVNRAGETVAAAREAVPKDCSWARMSKLAGLVGSRPKGTTALTWPGPLYRMGALMPLKTTAEVSERAAPPKIVMISPGLIGPGNRLAALTIPAATNDCVNEPA